MTVQDVKLQYINGELKWYATYFCYLKSFILKEFLVMVFEHLLCSKCYAGVCIKTKLSMCGRIWYK